MMKIGCKNGSTIDQENNTKKDANGNDFGLIFDGFGNPEGVHLSLTFSKLHTC